MSNSNRQYNPYDEMGIDFDPEELERHKKEQEALYNKIDQLIHMTFAQTEAGAELLELWIESLKMSPGARPGMENIEIGLIEGQKSFIRNIIITIQKVENDE